MKLLWIALILFSCAPASATQDTFALKQQISFSATGTSSLALAANPYRKYLLIQNNGSASVTVTFNAAQSASEGVVISAGGNYEPFKASTNSVYLKSASGTQACVIVEGQ